MILVFVVYHDSQCAPAAPSPVVLAALLKNQWSEAEEAEMQHLITSDVCCLSQVVEVKKTFVGALVRVQAEARVQVGPNAT